MACRGGDIQDLGGYLQNGPKEKVQLEGSQTRSNKEYKYLEFIRI